MTSRLVLICDTSGLLSAHAVDQPHHEASLEALNAASDLIVSPLVLCEVDYLATARHGSAGSRRIMAELTHSEYEIAQFTSSDLRSALDIMNTYADLELGVTDASLVVLANRYDTHEVLTLDQRHFRVLRGLDGRPFRLLPFDQV